MTQRSRDDYPERRKKRDEAFIGKKSQFKKARIRFRPPETDFQEYMARQAPVTLCNRCSCSPCVPGCKPRHRSYEEEL